MQIMSDSLFQYRSNQNQFENDYDAWQETIIC